MDIQKPTVLNHGLLRPVRGLKTIGQLFSKDKTALMQSLKEGIKNFFKPRLSYKPETLFNKALSWLPKPVRTGLKSLGFGNPGCQTSAFVGKFAKVDQKTDPNTLKIPGYNTFRALSRDTQIAMLGGCTHPDSIVNKLGLFFIRPNSGNELKSIERQKAHCVSECEEKLKDINKRFDPVINAPGETKTKQLAERLKARSCENALANRDANIKKLDQRYNAIEKTINSGIIDQLFHELPPNIKDSIKEYGAVVDKSSGLAASLLFDPARQTIHVIMGGTSAGNDLNDEGIKGKIKGGIMGVEQGLNDITSVGLLSNHVPPSYEQARDLVGAIKHFKESHDLDDLKIEVKGFSMGGGMAAYAGIYHGVKALSHCGAPVSPACQRSLGSEKMEKAMKEKMIFNTSVQGDWVSDRPLIQALGRSWESITSLQVARHVGNGLRLSGEGMKIGNKDWNTLGMGKHINSSNLFKAYEPKMIKEITQI